MQEVMRQFGTILKNIVKKPMDFSTIRKQMDANVYKNVREIYADVRLVFTNAMTYNDDDKSDIHVMARTLLERFEEKWLQLIHKVVDAEERQKDEEAQALTTMQSAQEAAIAKLARDTNNELNQLNLHLGELRELVIQSCRKMTTEEKRKLSSGIASLCPEYLFKALEIIAQENPNFQDATEEVDIDIDAQNEITLWRLKFFVKGALENQARNSVTKPKNQAKEADDVMKRKKLIYDALAKTARKRSRKPSP
ncbi:transcription factor GTE1-like [Asparagus officinalis]|uniref:transcription factor GTE1-like n=1 Tax=Asparagus officinalis TaxID=4686 RepID=UPI00098E2158|nr:transcription factor GTE1-like [Asparagus officinalis]